MEDDVKTNVINQVLQKLYEQLDFHLQISAKFGDICRRILNQRRSVMMDQVLKPLHHLFIQKMVFVSIFLIFLLIMLIISNPSLWIIHTFVEVYKTPF